MALALRVLCLCWHAGRMRGSRDPPKKSHGISDPEHVLFMQDDRGGAITVLVALVAHKWVESLALSARCLKIGANWWCALRTPAIVCWFQGVRIAYTVHGIFPRNGAGLLPQELRSVQGALLKVCRVLQHAFSTLSTDALLARFDLACFMLQNESWAWCSLHRHEGSWMPM